MRVLGLCWLGLRTQQFDEMAQFFRDVMGMKPIREEPGIAGFQMIDDTNLELYEFDEEFHAFFTTGPVSPFRSTTSTHLERPWKRQVSSSWSNPTHGQIQLESLPRSRRYGVRDSECDR
jgi:catechol 2,3-dioxygenase-like lactoylglutathione lyase family enzyme